MPYIRFIASVDKEHRGQLDRITHQLEELGFSIDKVRKLTGTISGSVENVTSIHQVNIPGLTVEPERAYYTQVDFTPVGFIPLIAGH